MLCLERLVVAQLSGRRALVTMAELPAFFVVAMNVLLLGGPGLTNGKRDNSVWVRGERRVGGRRRQKRGEVTYTQCIHGGGEGMAAL